MIEAEDQPVNLSPKKLKAIRNDPEQTANAIDLVYVNDSQPGITRITKGKNFQYLLQGKRLTDKAILQRIKSLVIPPAWENVWICKLDNGHLQATGLDVKKRKQYKYHPHWNSLRNQTKFFRLLEFGKTIPTIRQQLEKDIALPGLPLEKVLALIVLLMERTSIRIGNNFYEKLYGSFGLTTLKDSHVVIKGNRLQFLFKGKKGVEHNISLKSKRLSAIVQKCRDIPGKELFQYYDESGARRPIDSGMVNDYIRKISAADFSAKDFRTWSGTVYAFLTLKELGDFDSDTECKKKIVEALDTVAKNLGNTRTVCRKYYVHPAILSRYENGKFVKYYRQKNSDASKKTKDEIEAAELEVLKILASPEA